MILPERLCIKGRSVDQLFKGADLLHREFEQCDFNPQEQTISLSAISFPDFSCNWSKYSEPKDVHYRANGSFDNGCCSFLVNTVRHESKATPVHDPLEGTHENYAHVEVRALLEVEGIDIIPAKGRKLKGSKAVKQRYRQYLVNNAIIQHFPKEL